jgi:plastocyanin
MRHDLHKGDPAGALNDAAVGARPDTAGSGRARLSWLKLAQTAAAGELLVLTAVGIGRRDRAALAIAALLLIAAGLAQRKRALPGLVLLALLFTDVAAFMLPAAVSNLVAREALGGIALPASLAAMSLAGLIAAVAAVVATRRGRSVSRGPVVVAAAAAVVVLATALAAVTVAKPPRAAVVQGSQRLTLQAARTAFSATSLAARPGRVTVSLANHDLFWHTFTIERLGVNLDVPVGGTRTVTFTAAAGTYKFICTIPGHAAAGMRGTLIVR